MNFRNLSFALIAVTSFALSQGASAEIVLGDPTPTPAKPKPSQAYQQTTDDPCVFGGADCKSPNGWSYVLTDNGGSDHIQKWSMGTSNKKELANTQSWTDSGGMTFYSYEQLSNVLICGKALCGIGDPSVPTDSIGFFVGIDNNPQGSESQYLHEFSIYECNDTTAKPDTCNLYARYFNNDVTNLEKNERKAPVLVYGFEMTLNHGTGFSDYILAGGMQFTQGKFYSFFVDYYGNNGPDSFFLINENTGSCVDCGQVPAPGTVALLGIGLAAAGLARRRRRF